MNFQRTQQIKYDPRHIISNRQLKNKIGPFEHQEIEGLSALANLEYFPLEQQQTGTDGELHDSQGTTILPSHLAMHVQIPMKNDKYNKRTLTEATDMEIYDQ